MATFCPQCRQLLRPFHPPLRGCGCCFHAGGFSGSGGGPGVWNLFGNFFLGGRTFKRLFLFLLLLCSLPSPLPSPSHSFSSSPRPGLCAWTCCGACCGHAHFFSFGFSASSCGRFLSRSKGEVVAATWVESFSAGMACLGGLSFSEDELGNEGDEEDLRLRHGQRKNRSESECVFMTKEQQDSISRQQHAAPLRRLPRKMTRIIDPRDI